VVEAEEHGAQREQRGGDEIEDAVQPPSDPAPRAEGAVAAEREQQQDHPERHEDGGVLTGASALDQQQATQQQLDQLMDPERDPTGGRVVVRPGHRPSLRGPRHRAGTLREVTGTIVPEWARHLPAGVDPGSVDLLAGRSLPAAWAANWRSAPDAPAVHDDHGWITNAELDARSRRIAGRLTGAGLRPGDRIVMSATTSVELVVAHVAALRLGLVVVPVNGAYRERELQHIVSDCGPRACVVDADRTELFTNTVDDGCIVTTPSVELVDAESSELDASTPDDVALLCYTSGTTGAPKGAMLTHGNTLASCEALRLAWRWTESDRLVLALPLFHVHGLGVGLHGTLLAGASVVLLPRFDAEEVLDAALDHDATLFFGVPTMYARLAPSARVAELGRLRLCVSGSAPLPAALHAELTERAGIHVLERYGMTETIMNVSNPYDGERRPGTVGIPLPGVDVRLDDPSSEILLRGPNVFPGYWRREEATRDAFTDDGWFRSGDIGASDPDGYLRIVGRAKELIISGGYNVYPREVEDVLLEHPAVAEVAVVGEPSDEWGEVVVAVVVAGTEDRDAEGLLAFAAEQLAPYKRPRRVRYVDALPRNALGKVVRSRL
jgi:malonyl-CoA/methylmalonyl-CoA synthetase